ncbi:c-type cytochrome biogenesis protein CcmI [Microbulbifer thermotolerans]|uniref:C-type cytochrome biogenesis protein CcmI n=1 Tax=Microbulbifer thermotolerans TaxID=252514 RepID=A0AB35HZ57_MICTH|nr:c-type cytochrome biogenesis protein CcmI [Microbulbifer thermotolerans]MCX2801440.1 c-type cytochrome biogenesis protein CcmI [Microbulbifer thermotolerans]
MIGLWFGVALLALLLACVILWSVLRGAGKGEEVDKSTALAALYREQRAELRASLDSGAIDKEQHAQLEAEMARNLLAAGQSASGLAESDRGRGLLFALVLIVPLVAVGLYRWSGNAGDLSLYRDMLAAQKGSPSAENQASIIARLKARAERHPDDLTGRYVLAQWLLAEGDLQGAVESYRYVVEREPQAVVVKAELAQALFFANGSRIDGEVRGLVRQVLDVQPDNGTALGLAGIEAFERGDFRMARQHWQRALNQLPAESAAAQALAAGVARAERALADSGEPMVPVGSESDSVAGPAIHVRVNLAEGVSAEPSTPVFVYARGADSPMPLAIVRLSAGQLPAEVVLDESRAMMPGRSIANVDTVQLVARLAVNGDARPAPGDWQGSIETLPKSAWGDPVAITIDSEL